MHQDCNTALIWAARNGHAEMAKLLMERGASIDVANKVEKTFNEIV